MGNRLWNGSKFVSSIKIETAFGKKTCVRCVGGYYFTLPTPSAPNGEWWVLNPQRGYVPVPSNGRALQAALAAETK